MKKVMLVFGTRPEAIKMCPLVRELQKRAAFQTVVCGTGQHQQMLADLLSTFGVVPDYQLSIMKERQTLFDITVNVLRGMEDILKREQPDMVLVQGDTSTTFAAALAVIVANGLVFHDVDSIIYGLIFNFVCSAVINKMMFGFSSSMLAMIVTDDGEAACKEIDRVADRGATILQGRGGYGGAPKDVVLCACSNKQLYEIEHAIQKMDPASFIIMLQSNEVHGEGFRQLELGKSEENT